jgi:hypothetical protein
MLKKSVHGLFQARKPKINGHLAHKIKMSKFLLDFGRPSLGTLQKGLLNGDGPGRVAGDPARK